VNLEDIGISDSEAISGLGDGYTALLGGLAGPILFGEETILDPGTPLVIDGATVEPALEGLGLRAHGRALPLAVDLDRNPLTAPTVIDRALMALVANGGGGTCTSLLGQPLRAACYESPVPSDCPACRESPLDEACPACLGTVLDAACPACIMSPADPRCP